MKNLKNFFYLLLVLLLSACARSTPDSSQISNGIFTAVAQTLTAQYTPIIASDTPTLETMTPTTTLIPFVTSTPNYAVIATKACESSFLVSDVTIPDNSSLVIGTTFTKTWAIQNTGTCPWTSTFTLKFYSGAQMGGTTTTIGSAVVSGGTINISVNMTAPTTPGNYTGWWHLVDDSGQSFGEPVSVIINAVVAATGTTTVTPSVTPTTTFTPIIIIVTATPQPTNTNTPTPTVTPSITASPS
jgi:Ig-like domain from next to BRCA1 gene